MHGELEGASRAVMPALRKPHRVAVLVSQLTVAGADAAIASEAALLLWIACIEACQRHPGLAVLDAEATPLAAREGHLVPQAARPGATPDDAFHAPSRRDEVIWLELALPRPAVVQLHALGRDGARQRFEAVGDDLGRQIDDAIGRWLAARGLGRLPRPFAPVSAADLLAVVRAIAPALAEQARAVPRLQDGSSHVEVVAERSTAVGGQVAGADSQPVTRLDEEEGPVTLADHRRRVRALAGRLGPALRAPALRLLALALREDLGDLVLAADPEQPQVLLDQFRATAAHGRDYGLLRRIIAHAPGWARPYDELIGGASRDPSTPDGAPPSELEAIAGAGLAAVCRPDLLDVLETAADRLDDSGRVDEAVRLIERAVALAPSASGAHVALVSLQRRTDRRGAWLAQAERTARLHGCPLDPRRPWYPDQIQVDLLVSDALERIGRLDEAIALRANHLDGRTKSWPRHARILASWRKDPRFVARCYAREGHHRGDPARALEGFGRAPPADAADVASVLDALVALGREDEVALAWAALGLARQLTEPVARLAAARGMLAAGDWRRGVEELWRVELTEPGRDEHAAIARCGRLLAAAPLDALEPAIGERIVMGAAALARRMARDIADFVPGAHASSVVLRALGKATPVEIDPAWFAGFPADAPSRRAIDALFGEATRAATAAEAAVTAGAAAAAEAAAPEAAVTAGAAAAAEAAVMGATATDVTTEAAAAETALVRADRLVNGWLAAVFTEASEQRPAALVQAAAYAAAHALVRYFAATCAAPSPLAGGYRTVAAEALALVWRHRAALDDRTARAVLGAIDRLLRRIDRWLGIAWLGTVERSLGLDERARGDLAGFAADHATVAARLLGPEETAVLAASIARLHRERPRGWAAAVITQAARLAAHTGHAGAVELADAVAAQLAAREIEPSDAIDLLHTASYVCQEISAVPCVHAARILLANGRAATALAVLCAGLPAAEPVWRAAQLASLAEDWAAATLDVPLAFDALTVQLAEALQRGDHARAEKLGSLAVAIEPHNQDAHKSLGLALAHQGKLADALDHLARGASAQALALLRDALAQRGASDARLVAGRGWSPASSAAGPERGSIDRGSDSIDESWSLETPVVVAGSGRIAGRGLPAAVSEAEWPSGSIDERTELAARADLAFTRSATLRDVRWDLSLDRSPTLRDVPDPASTAPAAPAWDVALDRSPTVRDVARASAKRPAAVSQPARDRVFELLAAGDVVGAEALCDEPDWRVRRGALTATRYRYAAENHVAVPARAGAAATVVLADTVGLVEREAALARSLALAIREQAYFARDPAPTLGSRISREAFQARSGAGSDGVAKPAVLVDRVVVPGGRVERITEYAALLRDLAELEPREALAQLDLDGAAYAEVATAWAAVLDADPAVAQALAGWLAKR